MIRAAIFSALWLTTLAHSTSVAWGQSEPLRHGQSLQAVVPHVRSSGWTTTVHIEVQPTKRREGPLVTASLPPVRIPKPQGRLTGNHILSGIASYYWQEQKTATGERFDKMAMTAAHKSLPFGTKVRVTDATSGRSVVVRINDRGPFKPGRVIDLSLGAAQQLGMTSRGLTPVKIEVVN